MPILKVHEKQSKIISFIQDYYNEYGISPTVREIQNGCNITSTSVVDYNLKALKNKGYLDKRPDISRAIKLNNVDDNIMINDTHWHFIMHSIRNPVNLV